MNFDLYKPRLVEYLRYKGIDAHVGLMRCFSPNHDDKNPSCELFSDHFVCYSGKCGIQGDIYDAVEVLEGISDPKEQFLEIEKTFGGSPSPLAMAKEARESFTPDPVASAKVETYMRDNPGRERSVRLFLSLRAKTSGGKLESYPPEILENLVKYFFYWPGLDIARGDLGSDALRAAGIPLVNPQKGYSTWDHSGVVIKLGSGYKLHYYQDGECKKINSKSGCAFPTPAPIDCSRPIILVEGEMDALSCRAAGIENVFSTGGTNGLTGPKIKKSLLTASEIIILFDNDDAGKKTMGLIPIARGEKRICLPESLRKNGFTGIIRVGHMADPYKDADDAIRTGKSGLVREAIAATTEYKPLTIESKEERSDEPDLEPHDSEKEPDPVRPETSQAMAEFCEEDSVGGLVDPRGRLTLKELKGVLKKIEKDALEASEIAPFVSACWNILDTTNDTAWKALHLWGAPDDVLNKPMRQDPSYLVTIARKYGLSQYFISRLENVTITKDQLQGLISKNEPVVKIDHKKITESEDWEHFIQDQGTKTAANIAVEILKDCFIFVESDKKHYYYNGHIWIREPDPRGLVFNIFSSLLKYHTERCSEYDDYTIRLLEKTMQKIEQYRFRSEIVLDLSSSPEIFRPDVLFDSPSIRETLTLQDGVLDFSTKQVKFRKSTQAEYRRDVLPYKVEDIKNAGTPEKFMAFMNDNFKDPETMQTLMYYLSLIPSRQTQYKYGGIFIGRPHTGKTTTIELIMKIYSGMMVRLPSDALVSVNKRGGTNNGPNPYIARLEGKGAAVAQETERNGFLNGALWKELTGGDTLTARGMYSAPRDFTPTAQIIMASNHSPRFDSKDQATIDRMVVIPFRVEHKHGSEGTREQTDIMADLEQEYPAVVRMLAEYYIKFKHDHKGKIPLSKECAAYKDDYVQDQETDLDRFVEDNIDFVKDENCHEKIKDVYNRYLSYYNFSIDESGKPLDKEAWSQNKFTRFLKHDYTEVRVKQKKINGYPEQIFMFMKLKPAGKTAEPSLIDEKDDSNTKGAFNDGYTDYSSAPDEDPFN
jgi:phage/plasmid-associated DNA primase/5S rRNA maturation endonuclease (ribonuclease M5)